MFLFFSDFYYRFLSSNSWIESDVCLSLIERELKQSHVTTNNRKKGAQRFLEMKSILLPTGHGDSPRERRSTTDMGLDTTFFRWMPQRSCRRNDNDILFYKSNDNDILFYKRKGRFSPQGFQYVILFLNGK